MPNKTVTQKDLTGFAVGIGKLETKIDFAIQRIGELEKGTVNRIESLERSKADRVELDKVQNALNDFQKHVNENIEARVRGVEECEITKEEKTNVETRINSLEDSKKWIWVIVAGYILIASCVIGYCVLRIDANFTLITNYMEQTK